jgi:hypothetical protein
VKWTAAGIKFEMICWVEEMENITFNKPIIHNMGINTKTFQQRSHGMACGS